MGLSIGLPNNFLKVVFQVRYRARARKADNFRKDRVRALSLHGGCSGKSRLGVKFEASPWCEMGTATGTGETVYKPAEAGVFWAGGVERIIPNTMFTTTRGRGGVGPVNSALSDQCRYHQKPRGGLQRALRTWKRWYRRRHECWAQSAVWKVIGRR